MFFFLHFLARNIKFGKQINMERIPLVALLQAVVISLAHNHVANLFISNYKGTTVIKLGNKSHSVVEVDKALLHWE